MTFLNYKTNKNLLSEMRRIWPEFELESEYIFYSESEHKNGSYIKFLTPGDLIIFLQTAWEEKLIHKENTDYFVNTIHNLIFEFKIFLSTKNFEAGAIWLLGKLQQIRR